MGCPVCVANCREHDIGTPSRGLSGGADLNNALCGNTDSQSVFSPPLAHNPLMVVDRKNVQSFKGVPFQETSSLGVKHLSLRLPTKPDFTGEADESAGLTRLRAISELLTGQRLSIHALLIKVIDSAKDSQVELPVPKADAVPSGSSVERIDVRVKQSQILILDALRDQIKPRPDIVNIREYYGRVDVLRALLQIELARLERQLAKTLKHG